MTLELLAKLAEHAETRPDDPAVRLLGVGREEALSWRELHDRTAACAARLAADVKAGGVVMLCSPNAPLFSAAFLAALAAGMKLFPVSAELTAVEVAELAEHTEPQLVIGDDFAIDRLDGVVADALSFTQLRDLPEATMPTQGKASDLLLLSSGTTSRSKIVRRTGKSLDAAARTITHAVQLTADDAVLAAVPQCHSYGLEHGILAPTYVGARVTQTRGFDGRAVLHLVSDGDLTVLPGVPFMFEALAQATEEPAQLEGLRVAYSAGAPLPARVFDDLHDRLGLTVGQVYGSTEVGSVTFNAPDNGTFDAGCVGRAMNGVAIRILDPAEPKVSKPLPPGEDGHVAISSHAMLEEYIGDDAPIEQGFFLTGDLGRLDDQDRLTITGRIKLMIDVGGLKVNPIDVERTLAQHPSVGACVVVAVEVSDTVSRLKAYVTAADGASIDAAELREFARSRLAGYKVPRVFEVIDELPRTPSGKVDRRALESH